jgi:hypothetical protein
MLVAQRLGEDVMGKPARCRAAETLYTAHVPQTGSAEEERFE